jgi:peptidoglycan hydrolase CwlO-like protein
MKTLFIMLAQSNTGAVILILALLLIAGVIGYLTAWFYAKSIYTPVIKRLEAEKAELTAHVVRLKEDILKLNATIDELNARIGKLEAELGEKEKELQDLKKTKIV